MRRALTIVLLVALSFASRLPALLNPDTTNSDASIVGLQAMHILGGERSPLLMGSHYQTSVDAFVAAPFFAVMGATPLALMVSALSLHVLLTLFVFAMLDAVVGTARAFVLSLVLVFTGAAVHSYALYPPRQAALTVAFAAVFALARARQTTQGAPWLFAIGGALGAFALFADPYALLFVPAIVVAAIAALRDTSRDMAKGTSAFVLGTIIGVIPLLILARHPEWKRGETSLAFDVLSKNVKLLLSTCGPWAFGTKVYRPVMVGNYVPWIAPLPIRGLQLLGGAVLAAACFVAPLASLSRKFDSDVRRIGLVGGTLAWTTLGGFLLSVMVMDHFSMRYLAAAILAAPLGLAPLASKLSVRALSAWAAPVLATGIIGGWASFGTVEGLRFVHLPGRDEERALLSALDDLGIHEGVADYWVSYRLTFFARERLVVVPSHRKQDRYLPYRERVEGAAAYAYIVDAYRSNEPRDVVEARLRATARIRTVVERGPMTAFVIEGPVPRS